MSPRLLPSNPVFRSNAEKVVWSALKSKLPAEAFLAANMRLGSHEDFYEADLVVGLPGQGFVVIEVKGGQVERTDEGWLQHTREGSKHIDPAGQADRGKRLLDSYLRLCGWSHGPIRFEHMVAFPDMDFGPEPPSPDLPRWQLIDRGDVADAAGRVWDALERRITDKPRPTAAWVDEAADLLGGRPEPARALLGARQDREDFVTRLTEDQYRVLTMVASNPAISVIGGPGTGKTWLAGFLPGDMREKVDPYLRPIYDALYDFMEARHVERGLQTGMIEIAPLAFMRGRTLTNAMVLLDEAQNTTSMQMKMFLTRLGEGSRMIITGDPTQIDLPPGQKSGLVEAVRVLDGVMSCVTISSAVS